MKYNWLSFDREIIKSSEWYKSGQAISGVHRLVHSRNLNLNARYENLVNSKFSVRKENENDKIIITDETNLKNIKREKDKLILSPLIGLTENQIDKIYKKITEL